MTHDVIAALLILGLIIAFAYLAKRSRQTEEDIPTQNMMRLIREIDTLHRRAHELEDVDNLLIDLRLCKHGESFRAFHMGWQSASGKEHTVDFLTDGSDLSARQMMRLAEAKREELNGEIAARIADLYTMACMQEYEMRTGMRDGEAPEEVTAFALNDAGME